MRPQDHTSSSPDSSTDNKLPQNPGVVFQDRDLLTAAPPSERRGTDVQTTSPKVEQKIFSPAKPKIAELDSLGGIRIDLTIPASAFTLGRLLGKGGFGAVYEGVYNGKPVAVKQLSAHLSEDALNELKREAGIMFQLGLTSEHIVKVIKICLESPYSLVMELMPKGSLYDVLHNGQDLPWKIRFQIALDAAAGLQDLHEHKPVILHRDLKSLNILLYGGGDQWGAKLGDFGLAKVKHETGSQSSVAKGGTVLWLAPELFDDEPKITTASDIYSFGMVLWELVTRALPYAKWRSDVAGIRIAQGKKEEIPSNCPPELKKIIESCWETLPTKRPTAVQVVERLKPLVTTGEQKQPSTSNSKEDLRELEMQKWQAEKAAMEQKMAQMQLAHEQQLAAAAVEAKQRAKAEKQTEIERLKQQHQTELKRSQPDSKLRPPSQTIATLTKPLPIPAMSQILPQTLMPAPKSEPVKVSKEQLKLQDELVIACEQGDIKAVQALFKTTFFRKITAKPDVANTAGKQPLGAAVWGMNPDVVNELLKQAGGVAPMTWDECEKHNLKYYKEVFIVPKFDPQTYEEWYQLLQKMDPNPFIRAFHLKNVDEQWHDKDSSSWERLYGAVRKDKRLSNEYWLKMRYEGNLAWGFNQTETGYVGFRTQIKQGVESASRPTVGKTF